MTRKRTLATALQRVATMSAEDVFATGNSYLGLFRQATHSHHHRTHLAKALRARGHAINHHFTKIYQRTPA